MSRNHFTIGITALENQTGFGQFIAPQMITMTYFIAAEAKQLSDFTGGYNGSNKGFYL
jgi:hypothetical protein